jgi:hypothetical protein
MTVNKEACLAINPNDASGGNACASTSCRRGGDDSNLGSRVRTLNRDSTPCNTPGIRRNRVRNIQGQLRC